MTYIHHFLTIKMLKVQIFSMEQVLNVHTDYEKIIGHAQRQMDRLHHPEKLSVRLHAGLWA